MSFYQSPETPISNLRWNKIGWDSFLNLSLGINYSAETCLISKSGSVVNDLPKCMHNTQCVSNKTPVMWGENSKLYKGFVSGLPINLIDITVTIFQSYFCPNKAKKKLALAIFLKSKQFYVFGQNIWLKFSYIFSLFG